MKTTDAALALAALAADHRAGRITDAERRAREDRIWAQVFGLLAKVRVRQELARIVCR